jgi:6-phosphogluconolactonase
MTLYGVELEVLADAEAVAARVADELVTAARAGQAVVLTGGTSPGRAYELAAEREPDWSTATLWWGDERCVPPEHEDSNYRLARESLLDRLEAPPREIRRIRGELGAADAAREYDELLRDAALDLVLLGIGPDGHTASLFPRAAALDERKRRAVAAQAQLEPFVERVTLTLPAFAAAGELLFLVAGDEKSEAARRAFAAEPGPETPASLVRSEAGVTTAILDSAAAVRLSDTRAR